MDYPGDPPYQREVVSALDTGSPFELSRLTLSSHSGTHLDAPAHFIRGGKSIAEYRVEDFILPALVLNIEDPEAVRPAELELADLPAGAAVLFKTNNSRSGLARSGRLEKRWVYLSEEAASRLQAKQVALVGIDYVSIERFEAPGSPIHRQLLKAGILILEGINLAAVPPGRYTLICPPLKIQAEAAPTRAILLKTDD